MSDTESSIDDAIARLASSVTRVTVFAGYQPEKAASATARIYSDADPSLNITLFGNGESSDARKLLIDLYGVPSTCFNKPTSSPSPDDFRPPVMLSSLMELHGHDVYLRGGELYLLSRDS